MKRAEGAVPRLSGFALAIMAAFALTPGMVMAQEETPPPVDAAAAPAETPPPADMAPPAETPPPSDMPPAESSPPPDMSSSGDFGGGDSGGGNGSFLGLSPAFSGFVRLEAAYHASDRENPNNLRGNPFNGVPQTRHAFPGQGAGSLAALSGLTGDALANAVNDLLLAAPAVETVAARNTPPSNNDWNLQQLRGKFDLNLTFSPDVQLYSSVRTMYDFGRYDNWDPDDIGANPDGFSQQKPNFFEYDSYHHGGCLNYLEVCGKHYMADFTSLYLDIQKGPILVRIGQQQIAWGQALFFRIFDVPNGLDLRRHLILDDALEEYADERVASPGVRVTWQVTDQWELDSYAQLFVPTTYPMANTPYNVIPAQFSVHETWTQEHSCSHGGSCDFNYGLRARANFGNWGLQFIATRRWNQEGVFRWTASGVNKDLPGLPGTGALMAGTPLEADPSGVWSANEWFTYAGMVRLNGVEGVNTLVNEYTPFTTLLGGSPIGDSAQAAARELDLFFMVGGGAAAGNLTSGGLRGHIAHQYFQENIFGAGASYVVEAEPGSLLDQLIINVETSFIPNRRYTEQSLSRHYTKADESVSDLVMEKYHRWFEDFPATYMVFQAIHRTKADLFGRYLGCMGGTGGKPGSAAADENDDTKACHGVSGGHTDVVLAALQPFPNYIYRLSGAVLVDVQGGLLAQAGFRWSPGHDWTLDFFYNYLDGHVWGNKNENIIESISWADEFAVRIGYAF